MASAVGGGLVGVGATGRAGCHEGIGVAMEEAEVTTMEGDRYGAFDAQRPASLVQGAYAGQACNGGGGDRSGDSGLYDLRAEHERGRDRRGK